MGREELCVRLFILTPKEGNGMFGLLSHRHMNGPSVLCVSFWSNVKLRCAFVLLLLELTSIWIFLSCALQFIQFGSYHYVEQQALQTFVILMKRLLSKFDCTLMGLMFFHDWKLLHGLYVTPILLWKLVWPWLRQTKRILKKLQLLVPDVLHIRRSFSSQLYDSI